MGKWRVLDFTRLHPCFMWDGGLLFRFILSKIAILDKIDGKFVPPPSTQVRDGTMARFGFCAASSLICGGWGFAVPFYSVQDCRFRSAL